jgi:hypothetical protein
MPAPRRSAPRDDVRPAPAPFVVGVPRSGTTLLRLMLDAHPDMAVPPETYFVPDVLRLCGDGGAPAPDVLALLTSSQRWGDFGLDPESVAQRLPRERPVRRAEALRAFYGAYAQRAGKPRWGDKTPVYLKHMKRIARALPEARFVHIIRDGRDVALSVTGLMFGPDSVEEAARRWRRKLERARAQAPGLPHYTEVRYEDLVERPEPTLRGVCEYLELGWDPAMLEYHRHAAERIAAIARPRERPGREPIPEGYGPSIHTLTSEPPRQERVGRWRTEMSPEDRAAYERTAGELLARLGYEVGARQAPASDDG